MNHDLLQALLFIANYTAPCLIKADASVSALKMMGQMIGSGQHAPNAGGLLMCPVFSHKAGNLFNEEFALLKQLSNSGCQVDAAFQLLFDVKSKTEAHQCYSFPFHVSRYEATSQTGTL